MAMKRILITSILVMISALPVLAQEEEVLVHVIAELWEDEAVTAAEFGFWNLPVDQCVINEYWNTPLVIGNAVDGVSLAFQPPLEGPRAYLGSLGFIAHTEVGDDYLFSVARHPDSDLLIIVNEDFLEVDMYGWNHTFNCTDPEDHVYCRCAPV